jgi:1-acyl-sn-glycerol-3-phosphate acyltransferase
VAAVAVTALGWLASAAGSLLLAGSPRRRTAWRERVLAWWGRAVARALGTRVEVAGSPPRPPFLLVVNHLSWVDIPVVGGVTGGTFVAKAELDGWPLVGAICRVSGTIFIDRGSKRDLLRVGEKVEAHLAAGGGVVLFVEGTTGAGDAMLPFKPALLEVAARSRAPVHFATLRYATPAGEPPPRQAVCRWGDEPFLPHARRVLELTGHRATVTFGAEPLLDDDRKRLAGRLRRAMEEIFQPSE